jgi:hypothetical protein
MALFKATIEVLVEAEGVAHAEDKISAGLSKSLLDETSGWKDWQYCQMHNGEFQRFPGPKEIEEEDAVKEFDEYGK